MDNVLKLAQELTRLRKEVDSIKDVLKPLQDQRDEVQANLIEAMRASDLKSIKTASHNFARTLKRDVKVTDEAAALVDLEARGNKDQFLKLDTIRFKTYASQLLKETGEVMGGTEVTETEYISIKSNAKKGDKAGNSKKDVSSLV